MTARVREILDNYGAQSRGVVANLARILGTADWAAAASWSSCPSIRASSTACPVVRPQSTGGGFGSIIGRNTFQRPRAKALELLGAVMDIYAGD
jgi:hypothetical protein